MNTRTFLEYSKRSASENVVIFAKKKKIIFGTFIVEMSNYTANLIAQPIYRSETQKKRKRMYDLYVKLYKHHALKWRK